MLLVVRLWIRGSLMVVRLWIVRRLLVVRLWLIFGCVLWRRTIFCWC